MNVSTTFCALYFLLDNIITEGADLMDAVSYSGFRKNLKSFMTMVNRDSVALIVTAEDPEDTVVVMSKRDYDSMQETMYLLSNRTVMERIRRGDAQIVAGKGTKHELLEDDNDDYIWD